MIPGAGFIERRELCLMFFYRNHIVLFCNYLRHVIYLLL